jgi:hypothetical protein
VGGRRAGTVPPGLAPGEPTPEAVDRLRRVATVAWGHPPAAYDEAVHLVLLSPPDLLALLAHPPADVAAAEIWACLGLLHHGAEEPWLESARRRTLLDLLGGGLDRTAPDRVGEAALFALIVAAWVDPEARADVADAVARRLAEVAARPGARSVAELALATPDLAPEARAIAVAMTRVPAIPRQRRPVRTRLLLRWRRG